MQCAAGAAVALGSAGGIRAWLAYRRPSWFTGRLAGFITAGLLILGVLAAGLIS
jgi:hypothetical protein